MRSVRKRIAGGLQPFEVAKHILNLNRAGHRVHFRRLIAKDVVCVEIRAGVQQRRCARSADQLTGERAINRREVVELDNRSSAHIEDRSAHARVTEWSMDPYIAPNEPPA